MKDKQIAILGLAFKPNTDDMRFAPAVDVIKALQADGAKIRAYDPVAVPEAKHLLQHVVYAKDPYKAAAGADCLVLMTEWDEFKKLDLAKLKRLMRQPVIVDARNLFDPAKAKQAGFRYASVGRPSDDNWGHRR
jgi:UDPglucose 6-dehydrogenase